MAVEIKEEHVLDEDVFTSGAAMKGIWDWPWTHRSRAFSSFQDVFFPYCRPHIYFLISDIDRIKQDPTSQFSDGFNFLMIFVHSCFTICAPVACIGLAFSGPWGVQHPTARFSISRDLAPWQRGADRIMLASSQLVICGMYMLCQAVCGQQVPWEDDWLERLIFSTWR